MTQGKSDEDMFYDRERDLYNEWYGTFPCDTDSKFQCVTVYNGMVRYSTPPIVENTAVVGSICIQILDRCLESEEMFPMTFWLECMRCFAYDDYYSRLERPVTYIFEQFIAYMLRFNDTYPLTLPSIFHSTSEMHKAAQFYMRRSELLTLLIIRIYNTSITLKDPISEDEPLVEYSSSDEDASSDSESLQRIVEGFDLDGLNNF